MSILAVTLAVQLLAAAPAETEMSPAPAVVSLPPAKLRAFVHATLRRDAKAKGPERVIIAKELLALYQQIGLNQQMALGQRQQLQGLIGGRLQRAAQNDDYGPDLVDLIERTVSPGTWESQGGLGRIYYWRNGRALVVSQTQEAHEAMADLIGQLHAAGN